MSGSTEDRKEAAATRRRWVTLAEVVAVAGVIIAALTLWNGWSERNAAHEDKIAAASTAAREKSRIELTASVRNGGRALLLDDARYDIQDVSVTFPRALGIAVQRPAADPLILTSWFALPMLALTDGGEDERTGRLPVLITLDYWDGDATQTTRGIYDLVWTTHGRVGRGRVMQLEGMRIHERGGNQARLDAIWAREKP